MRDDIMSRQENVKAPRTNKWREGDEINDNNAVSTTSTSYTS